MMNLKRATIKQQLSEPEFQSIQQILIGELKAIDMVINEFTQLFEIHESETEEAPMLDEKADLEKGLHLMKQINRYIDSVFCSQDTLLDEVIASIKENEMPPISVSPSSGKLLTMLVSISGAKDILEIGALGGYSGICLAKGFGEEGR